MRYIRLSVLLFVLLAMIAPLLIFGCMKQPALSNKGQTIVDIYSAPASVAIADMNFAKSVYAKINLTIVDGATANSTVSNINDTQVVNENFDEVSAPLLAMVNAHQPSSPQNPESMRVFRLTKIIVVQGGFGHEPKGVAFQDRQGTVGQLNETIHVADTATEPTMAHEMWHLLTKRRDHTGSGLGKSPNPGKAIYEPDVKLIESNTRFVN